MAQPKPYGGDITDKQLRSAIASENGQVTCLKYYVRCEPQSIEDARHIIEEVDAIESARMAEQYQGDSNIIPKIHEELKSKDLEPMTLDTYKDRKITEELTAGRQNDELEALLKGRKHMIWGPPMQGVCSLFPAYHLHCTRPAFHPLHLAACILGGFRCVCTVTSRF